MEFNATFLISAISFVVFTFIMNAIFYKPLTEIIEEREKFINKTLDDAKNSQNIAQELLKNKEKTPLNEKEILKVLKTAKEVLEEMVSESEEEAYFNRMNYMRDYMKEHFTEENIDETLIESLLDEYYDTLFG